MECPVECLPVADIPAWACSHDGIHAATFVGIVVGFLNVSVIRLRSLLLAALVSGRMRRGLEYNMKASCPNGQGAFFIVEVYLANVEEPFFSNGCITNSYFL